MVDAVIFAMRTWKVPPLNKERGYPLTPLLLLSYPCVPERLSIFHTKHVCGPASCM